MVMCQAEAEQQSMIALCCVAGGEQSNNVQLTQSLHKALRGAAGRRRSYGALVDRNKS